MMNLKKMNESLRVELNEEPQFSDRLTQQTGREYAMNGPAVTRITKQDKRALLKEKDPAAIKAALEDAYAIIIAAATGTVLQATAIAKVNTLRTQLNQKLDQMSKNTQ